VTTEKTTPEEATQLAARIFSAAELAPLPKAAHFELEKMGSRLQRFLVGLCEPDEPVAVDDEALSTSAHRGGI
jgi:hypothetical protein